MDETYPDTWYAVVTELPNARDPLTKNIEADVCVVGGGLAGLVTAHELNREGLRVVVLEANRVAWGASGRNAGFVASGFAQSHSALVRRCGHEHAARLHAYSQLGVEFVRSFIQSHDPAIKMGDGLLEVTRHSDKSISSESIALESRRLNEQWCYSSREHLQNSLRTERYRGGIKDPNGFHINPLLYALTLAAACESRGVEIFECSRATQLKQTGAHWACETETGRVECEHVVLCTSAYDNDLFRPVTRAVLPVGTHIVVSEPITDSLLPIQTMAGISDSRRAGDYYRLVDTNRLLWGGKITTSQKPPRDLDAQVKRAILDVYPQLDTIKITQRWSGLMGYAIHKMPIVGEIRSGVWAATAFGGHGLNTTAMGGILIASGIARGDTRWRDFSRFKSLPINNPIGRMGIQLSYWGMQIRDWWDEKRST
ncbi:MAG: FAD-binding oxidoreductase [Pseudomonadota bacterium]